MDSEVTPSFPTYAELTQTRAWGESRANVHADPHDALEAAEISHGSRYTEGSVLGVGGMGKVLLARDARIGRDVAVKVLHSERELDTIARARFLREAQVQGQLEHPSIVPVYDIDRRSDGTTFFTMRRVLGRTLSAILDDLRAIARDTRDGKPAGKAPYTRRELLTAFATVCLTIDYAHSRGVVHRDLKPANIMLGDFGEVYVLDWGLARIVDEAATTDDRAPAQRLSLSGSAMGTPLYMAPEQMADPDVGPAADVFSLGLILFEILTLERARDPKAVYVPVDARPSTRAPDANVAPELETICVRATAMEVEDRYPTARALQEALNRYLEGDRELAQRRQLAAQHVESARAALGASARSDASVDRDEQRGIAMRELTRAIALEPRNEENVAMLADILANPPPGTPAEVARAHAKETNRIIRLGAHQSLFAMGIWVLAIPLLFLIGVEDARQFAIIGAPVALTVIWHLSTLRQETASAATQYGNIALVMIGGIVVSRLYGPFILGPVIITTNAVALQAHPLKEMQRFAVISAIAAILVAVGIEYTGLLPRSYELSGDRWTIVPQLVELPRNATFAFITIAYASSIVLTCGFIAKLRNDLTEVQLRLATQAWHFKQLGARLIGRDVG